MKAGLLPAPEAEDPIRAVAAILTGDRSRVDVIALPGGTWTVRVEGRYLCGGIAGDRLSALRAALERTVALVGAVCYREQEAARAFADDARGTVRINWRIVQAPIPLIEYVLAHELVHLAHRTHGPEFWATLGRMMPDYEEQRRRLRALGPALEW